MFREGGKRLRENLGDERMEVHRVKVLGRWPPLLFKMSYGASIIPRYSKRYTLHHCKASDAHDGREIYLRSKQSTPRWKWLEGGVSHRLTDDIPRRFCLGAFWSVKPVWHAVHLSLTVFRFFVIFWDGHALHIVQWQRYLSIPNLGRVPITGVLRVLFECLYSQTDSSRNPQFREKFSNTTTNSDAMTTTKYYELLRIQRVDMKGQNFRRGCLVGLATL